MITVFFCGSNNLVTARSGDLPPAPPPLRARLNDSDVLFMGGFTFGSAKCPTSSPGRIHRGGFSTEIRRAHMTPTQVVGHFVVVVVGKEPVGSGKHKKYGVCL